MSQKRKIGFFSFRLPYPLVSGGQIRAYYLLKVLAQEYDVTLFSFYKDKSELKYKEDLGFCKNIHVFPRRKLSHPLNLAYLMTGLPFASSLYYSPQIAREFRDIVDQEMLELIQFESYYPAVYMKVVPNVIKVFGTENLEYQVYEKFVNSQRAPLRQILKIEIQRMRVFEEKLYKQADFCLAVSDKEATQIQKVASKDVFVVPNGVDISKYQVRKDHHDPYKVIYTGSSKYFQNREAISLILNEIYPRLSKKTQLTIASFEVKEEVKAKAAKLGDVIIEDKTQDVIPIFKKADILLVPVFSAGGTRLKILEALASGVAVVSTKVGVEGLDLNPDIHYLEANSPTQFIEKTNYLLDHPERLDILANAGIKLVTEKYDWNFITKKLVEQYHSTYLV